MTCRWELRNANILVENLKERDHLENLNVDDRIILKFIFRKYDRILFGFIFVKDKNRWRLLRTSQ